MKHLFPLLLISFFFGCNHSEQKPNAEMQALDAMEKSVEWKKASPTGNELQCPCCDYFTLSKRGEYDICPICFWEDDGLDIDQPDQYSGPNHKTLREGRKDFERYGACDSSMTKHVIDITERNKFNLKKRTLK